MTDLSRREMLSATAALGALALVDPAAAAESAAHREAGAISSGRIKQSAARWCYEQIPLPQFCAAAKSMGLAGIDLLQQNEWDVVNNAGLVCSMGYASDRADFLRNGFTNRASHPMLLKEYQQALPVAKAKGVPSLIAMFGNRDGRSDAEAIAAATDGLKQVAPLAEQAGVTICVELLNSKVDHKGYHGDHTAFGVEIVSAVGSPRVKLLYDIYHMQIMEGDIIATIRANAKYIGHYHTGGVPGRHELDDTQELDWRGIMRAIADTGYTGFVAHEFNPTRDPLTSLREAVVLCDV
jgi:hydroxypyruvate isomerase